MNRAPTRLTILALALGALPPPATAQGPLYRERWGYRHLELRRQEVLREMAGRDRDTRAQVADVLAQLDEGLPFRGPARALALLRRVECDDAFLFRTVLSAYVLPEVVDPKGGNESCRDLNLSLFLPFPTPQPGKASFAVTVAAAGGGIVFETRVTEDTAVDDLLMARARAMVPCAGLPDGRYEARIETLLDGEGPRPGDPVLRHTFHVLRGYQERAEAALQGANPALARLQDPAFSLLKGIAMEVNRTYTGEAGAGPNDAVRDLELLEQALQNVAEERAVLHGMTGLVETALPAPGDHVLGAALRLPADRAPRPLVVIAGGAPAYDERGRRPDDPRARSARWLHDQCASAWPADRFHLCVLDSPGAGFDYAAALERSLAALRQLLPVADDRVFVVLEREAAVALCFQPAILARAVRGISLVSGGALPREVLQAAGTLAIQAIPLHGHPGGEGLRRTAKLLAGDYGPVEFAGSYRLENAMDRSWVLGVPACLDLIVPFAQDVLQR